LTGWDIDILTPVEFNKGLEVMADTLEKIEGVPEETLDKLAALGFVSVFDVEEAGQEVLIDQLGLEPEKAEEMVAAASARAKEVAEQQQKEKEEAERRRIEEEQAAQALLEGGMEGEEVTGELAAAAILAAGDRNPQSSRREVPTDPDKLSKISGAADARVEAILSGGEVADEEDQPGEEERAAERHEPDAGYDPGDADEAPSPSDSDEEEGEQIVESSIQDVLKKAAHREEAE
ncbi:MAG: hypothetical protein VYC34_10880, partial [Planctomycetota bacterium]|nr:hypothetical protein [Planctomycetota bacterium]